MTQSSSPPVAVVAGVGPGLGAALCRRLAGSGHTVAALSRSTDFPEGLAEQIRQAGGRMRAYECDTALEVSVDDAFARIEAELGPARTLVYNPGRFLRGGLLDTEPADFTDAWRVNCLGAFLCARRVVPGMLQGGGTLVFTGATASVRPAGGFAAFGASKSALRGLAQSLARELGPRGIHVAHVIIDGIVWTPRTQAWPGVEEDACLRPEAIADVYLHLIRQERSAWTFELDLRPDREPF